jgi:DNA-directed RNA polymerase sigma subunit (sigma70/sigma32)
MRHFSTLEVHQAMDDAQSFISIQEYEKIIFQSLKNDDLFFQYLKENKNQRLLLDFPVLETDMNEFQVTGEEEVLEYLEEISRISPEEEADLFLKNIHQVAIVAFHYLKGGASYLDVLQEGNLGLIQAIEHFENSEFSDFNNYRNYFIIREIVLFIKKRILSAQSEFNSFFRKKKEYLSQHKAHDHLLHDDSLCEHEISTTDFEEEDLNENFIDEKESASLENSLFHSLEFIRENEVAVKEKLDFFNQKNRLSSIEIELLVYYFGFEKEKRYSIYEIENELDLVRGDGEEIFDRALSKLSSPSGKIFL